MTEDPQGDSTGASPPGDRLLPLEPGAPRAAVVGGGLAGMAAAVALRTAGVRVTLFEARRYLGGRAASFRDVDSGDWVDLCQHVSMGCCTNLAHFCRTTGIERLFRRERVLHFFGDGRRCDFARPRACPLRCIWRWPSGGKGISRPATGCGLVAR